MSAFLDASVRPSVRPSVGPSGSIKEKPLKTATDHLRDASYCPPGLAIKVEITLLKK